MENLSKQLKDTGFNNINEVFAMMDRKVYYINTWNQIQKCYVKEILITPDVIEFTLNYTDEYNRVYEDYQISATNFFKRVYFTYNNAVGRINRKINKQLRFEI